MKYWHIQLHPSSAQLGEFTREHVQALLEEHGLIGMSKGWKNDRSQPKQFQEEVQIGDLVLVRCQGPLALCEVLSESIESTPTEDWHDKVWFEIARHVKVLAFADEQIKADYKAATGENWTKGLGYMPKTFSSADKSGFVKFWYDKLLQEK